MFPLSYEKSISECSLITVLKKVVQLFFLGYANVKKTFVKHYGNVTFEFSLNILKQLRQSEMLDKSPHCKKMLV